MKLNVFANCSYIGTTGINNQFRGFYRELSKYCTLKVRNFTTGHHWRGVNGPNQHDDEPYINAVDKKILYKQSLFEDGKRKDFIIDKEFSEPFHVNIISDITDHYYFYDDYVGPRISYTVWESTKMPQHFINKLKEYDEHWVPSEWQRDCMVAQGLDHNKVKILPSGIDQTVFFPEEVTYDEYYKDGRFKFVVVGRWDYRKSTKEIIDTFLKTFDEKDPVDLIISVDNSWPIDGMKTTEERLAHFGLDDSRIKVVHFASRENYIKFIKKGHVFLSCSRGEGINLPLMEAMACGTPAIYSNCTGQMTFTKGMGHPISIIGSCPSNTGDGGEYAQPDYNHLSQVMRDVYKNYDVCKKKALAESETIRKYHTIENCGKIGAELLYDFYNRFTRPVNANKEKLKVMFVTPHLSTGGMPQFLLKRIESINGECEVYCVEYEQIATDFVVQRNKIADMLGDRFISLHGKPKEMLLELIASITPDVIHFEEFTETFVARPVAEKIYKKDREYLIFESYHGLAFQPKNKTFFPDKFLFVSEFQSEIYKGLGVAYEIIPYPIDDHTPNKVKCQSELGLDPTFKHVLNVGLFTRGKNQGELIQYAKSFVNDRVKFHFVGNQAVNFEDYWGPLMKDLPPNCVIWGERNDVEKFYQACDLMVFTSVFETSPLVIREAISWKLPALVRNIPPYKNLYNNYPSVKYLSHTDNETNIKLIREALQ